MLTTQKFSYEPTSLMVKQPARTVYRTSSEHMINNVLGYLSTHSEPGLELSVHVGSEYIWFVPEKIHLDRTIPWRFENHWVVVWYIGIDKSNDPVVNWKYHTNNMASASLHT